MKGKEKRGSLVSHVLCCGEVRALWCFKGSSRSRFRSDSFVLSHTLMSRWSTEQLSRQTTDLEISWWTNNICSPVRWVNEKKKLKKSKFWKKIPSVYFRMWMKNVHVEIEIWKLNKNKKWMCMQLSVFWICLLCFQLSIALLSLFHSPLFKQINIFF